MEQGDPIPSRGSAAPRFYLTSRQRLRPEVILLAVVVAAGVLLGIVFALGQGHRRMLADSTSDGRAGSAGSADDDKDDPNQVDTIVLGGPDEAPVPAKKGNHVSSVHPTILIVLPRDGDGAGMIPDTEAGRLFFAWLGAFNKASRLGLEGALPSAAPGAELDAEMLLRKQTGGFNLVSAKEVEPGVLVFRVRDQTPAGNEALGTLWVAPDSIPAKIASLSVRMVPGAVER